MKKNRLRFTAAVLTACAAISALSLSGAYAAGSSACLAPDGDRYASSGSVEQRYSLAKVGDNYYDVSKVKVEWETTDIAVTYKDGKVWNPTDLSWDDPVKEEYNAESGTASFTLTNLSSETMNAEITFTAEEGFTTPALSFTVDGKAASSGIADIASVVKADKSVDKTIDHDVNISVELTAVTEDFRALADTDGSKFGSYTVRIGKSANSN